MQLTAETRVTVSDTNVETEILEQTGYLATITTPIETPATLTTHTSSVPLQLVAGKNPLCLHLTHYQLRPSGCFQTHPDETPITMEHPDVTLEPARYQVAGEVLVAGETDPTVGLVGKIYR